MSRAIAVGYPHHITQRGNYRQTVFREAEDYTHYLELLHHYTRRHHLEIWAYCLMPNHVHFVGVPEADDAMASVFRSVHMLYSQHFNRKANATGHLWQGRYYSCVLDEAHVYAAVRYVEMNPVRGGLVSSAEDYPWSSAKGHIEGTADPVLSGRCFLVEGIADWKQFLGEMPEGDSQANLIKATKTGRPCGKDDFVARLEALLSRRFATLPPGRPYTGTGKNQETADLFPKDEK
jgi:putative transposase